MKKIIRLFALSFVIVFLVNAAAFSANEYFRSILSGSWNANSTWQMSTNSGTNWIAATLTPTETSGIITVRNPNTVTVTVNVNADQLTIDSGGTLSINPAIILTLLNGTGNDITVLKGGTVSGAGTFQTQGTLLMNLRTGSNFNAALKVNTGTTSATDFDSPYQGKLFGNVTVDAGATLSSSTSSSYFLSVYGNLLNNGTITGSGSSNEFKFYGPALTNNGAITSPVFRFDSTSTITGSGAFTGADFIIGANGNVTLLSDVTFSPSSQFDIISGGDLNLNTRTLTFTSGAFTIFPGGTVLNSGIFKTQNTVSMNLRTGSSFNAPLNVNTGTTSATDFSVPYQGRLFGNVTVDAGATLSSSTSSSYFLSVYGNLLNNGTITGSGSSNEFKFYGPALTNNGAITSPIFRFDSTSTITGSGAFTGADFIIGANGNVTLLSNVTFSPSSEFDINSGGDLNLNTRTLTFASGAFTIFSGGTVLNSGIFKTQNTVSMNLRTGSSFNAPLNVNTGTTSATDLSVPYQGRLFGNVTVDAGATLSSSTSSSYFLSVYGNLLNNGTITGSGSSNEFKFYGPALTNNGAITSPIFRFDSTSTIAGSGSFTGGDIIISANENITLLNNVTFSPSSEFIVNTGATLSANTFSLTFNSGTFELLTGATVPNSGTFRTRNDVTLNLRTGSLFNIFLNVNTGTTVATDLSNPYNGSLYGDITIDTGATLSAGSSNSYNQRIYGNIINNGTITGGGNIYFQSGAHNLQGIGNWTTDANLLNGAVVTLTSNHQMRNVNINIGATFNIGNNTLKLTASNPIIQNGTFTNVNSRIEYNGTSLQSISTLNINYYGLRINNPAGTILTNNITIPDTLSVILGDLDLSGNIITISPSGYLTETSGNTVKGTSGYLITTRNFGIPSSLNVAGLGAVLTATSNLGNTEIKRGHTVQTGLNGGTSIRRYYDITPANNSGLTASLKYKFDDSELNGKPKPSLKLFKSTNSGSTWLFQGGNVNIATNEITLSGITSFSRWSADSSKVSAAIGLIMEGFYNIATNNLNMTDTVRAYLRNTVSPFAVVDSAVGLLDSLTFKSGLQFPNAPSGTYYIQLKHRNALETWSKAGVIYAQDTTLNYDFTFAANQAFGNNMVLKGTKYCLYSGDVTQEGFIDLTDVIMIYNDATAFATGYIRTDVNGDRVTDLTDILIAYNNSVKFISVKRPM